MVEITAINMELTPSVKLVRPSSDAGARNPLALDIRIGAEHIALTPNRLDE